MLWRRQQQDDDDDDNDDDDDDVEDRNAKHGTSPRRRLVRLLHRHRHRRVGIMARVEVSSLLLPKR